MKHHSSARVWPLLPILLGAVTLQAAIAVGGIVYTKRFETSLLAEPNPVAATASKVGLAQKLTVQETKGPWLRVTAAGGSGWIFQGNVTETKPDISEGSAPQFVEASKTTATAAARGLDPISFDYANRRSLGSARVDLEWLGNEGNAVSAHEVDEFLKAQKKGEFQ